MFQNKRSKSTLWMLLMLLPQHERFLHCFAKETGLLRNRRQKPSNSQAKEEETTIFSSLNDSSFLKGTSEVLCTEYRGFPGSRRSTLALPDKNTRYDLFNFNSTNSTWDAIRLNGEFPFGRYYSLNVYNDFTGKSIGASLPDYKIEPLPGHTNPFRPGANRYAHLRSFQVFLVREDSTITFPEGSNIIRIPNADQVEQVAIIARVYRPDEGFDSMGGVDPASITFLSFNEKTECPIISRDPDKSLLDLILFNPNYIAIRDASLEIQQDKVLFFRGQESVFFDNRDVAYASAALPSFLEVSVLRFRAPTFEDTYNGVATFQGGTEVRYWSICVGGLGLTTVSNCLVDDEISVDEEGIVTIVVGPRNLEEETLSHAGFTFLPRGLVVEPVVVVRHLLEHPRFEGGFSLVPQAPEPPEGSLVLPLDAFVPLEVRNFIGDYGPTGFSFRATESYLEWLKTQ